MGSINSQGVYEYDDTDDRIGPILLNRQSAALTNLFTGRAATVKVANVTQRAAALADHGTPTTENPLIVFRADAGAGRELEYTTDGTSWHTVAVEQDTDWTPVTLRPDFVPFASGALPHYSVSSGRVVTIRGAVSPATSAVANTLTSNTYQGIFTLPSQFLPSGPTASYEVGLHQGSGTARWLSRFIDGEFAAARYDGGNTSTSTWLPFSITYVV